LGVPSAPNTYYWASDSRPEGKTMKIISPILKIATFSAVMVSIACSQQDAAESEPAASEKGATSEIVDIAAPAAMPRTISPDGASVFFISPADGDTVTSPVSIEFGLEGMTVVKAGDKQADSGHHHLLVDTDLPDFGLPIPADEHHIHFGDGSTSTEISLKPGTHTLRLLLGDHLHIPHDSPIMSDPITIIVE
jgi:hypothetical protein